MNPLQKRQCWTCGGWFFEAFFRANRKGEMRASPLSAGVRRRCRGCERTTRDAVKAAHPLRLKALSLIQRHADRYIALGGVTSRAEFRTDCRFDLARVEDGLRDAWKEGAGRCEACQIPYTGLADVTLDIHDRERRWFFGTNTRWLCAECNSEKRHSNPDEWGAVLWSWEEWVRVRNAGPTQGDLFSIG